MWIVMSRTFREEVERHRLAFTCEACVHFCPEREACGIRYPTAPHRQAHVDELKGGERLYFCKMFEAK